MIVLQNFVKGANGYTLLLTMGEHDTLDMLPTAQKPFSPDYFAVSVDYGVPAPGSVAINYFTQENFMFVNGEWSKDSVPSVLEELTVTENNVYTPDAGVDGYDKVTVNVPQLDTSDATAAAADILAPKTAYVNGEKITGSLATESGAATPKAGAQIINPTAGKLFDKFTVAATPLDAATTVTAGTANKTVNPAAGNIGIASVTIAPTPSSAKTVTPTKDVQNVTPEDGQLLSGVTVNAIPAQYIVPTGSKSIVANGTVDVTNFASAEVAVPQLDTSDATAVATDILAPKTAYVNGTKVTGTLATQTKTATPTKTSQEVTPDAGNLLSKVTVAAIPAQYIIPTGSQTVTANGEVDVTALASVTVAVPNTVSELTITANGTYEAKAGEIGYSKIIVNVPTSAGE